MNTLESPLWRGLVSLPPYPLGAHRYLLVNQAAWQAEPQVIRDLQRFDRTALLGQSVDACVDGATPFLLRLDGLIDDSPRTVPLRRLCERGNYAAALHIIDASLPVQDLARAMTARCEASISEGQSVLLRYFDARVLDTLIDVLAPEQLRDLVSCTAQWWYAERGGEWVPIVVSPWPTTDTFKPPWHLDARQEHALMDASETDAVIDVLTRQNNQALLHLRYEYRYSVVHGLLGQARGWGLDGAPDLTAYCALGLMRGPDFGQFEPWRSLLPEVQAGRLRFDEALERAAAEHP